MGLNKNTKGERTFVQIVGGQFAKRVKEDDPEGVKRIIKNKQTGAEKTVHEVYFRDVNGMIESIEVDETGTFGDQIKVNMSDVGDNFTVTFSMASREAKSFLCCLKNIDLKKEIILAPYNFASKTEVKQVIGMNVYQGGRTKEFKVPAYFSKEHPNGLPQVPEVPEEERDKDEFKLVMKQQEIFLKKWVKKFIPENFTAKPVTAVADQDSKTPEVTPFEPTDDLPF